MSGNCCSLQRMEQLLPIPSVASARWEQIVREPKGKEESVGGSQEVHFDRTRHCDTIRRLLSCFGPHTKYEPSFGMKQCSPSLIL